MYELTILGGGPAGSSAAIYASRKQLKTALITKEFGGQSTVSDDIQNWIGTPHISGADLAKNLEEHVREYAGQSLEIFEGEEILSVEKKEIGFQIKTTNKTIETKTILVATGSHRRKLQLEGADRLEHRGITYCATCDGPLFSGMDTVVIGGGNAGFETASQLSAYAKSVTILQRSDKFKADEVTVEKVLSKPNVVGILNANTKEIFGEKFVEGLKYEINGVEKEIKVQGVFVEIGAVPTTEFVSNLVELNETKNIITDPKTQRTTFEGIWAAGDCTDGLYHQNNIAAGDAVKALEDIYMYVQKN